MSRKKPVLATIVEEFPSMKNEITHLFAESTGFIEICEDYVLCKESVIKLESLEDASVCKEINDLKTLLTELRIELLSRVNKMK